MSDQNYKIRKELKHEWYLIIIFLLIIAITILAYPHLPEEIATHWNLDGKPNGFSSRFEGVSIIPLITLALYILMLVAPSLDPRKENYLKFLKAYRLIKLGLFLFLLGIQLLVIVFNLGYNVNIGKITTLGLGILFALLGIYLPQIKHNYFIGIKTPWTLANEKVWHETHRLGGKLFLISGILIMLSVFLPDKPRFWLLMILLIGSSLIAMVYSYFLFKKENK
jgi:uncharacterized membrane protein